MDPKKKVKNRSIDLNNLYETHLSIQLSLNGFSFCVLDKTYDLVQKLVHHPFKDPAAGPEDLLVRVQAVFEKENRKVTRFQKNFSVVHQSCSSWNPLLTL